MAPKQSGKEAKILKSAHDLFWKHGFRRVTVEEICVNAGASKMTFYRYYPNKVELAKIVFNQLVDESITAFRQIMQEPSSPTEKIKKIILLKLEGSNDISHEFISDFYNSTDLELPAYVQSKLASSWQSIVNDFEAAQRSGIFRSDFNPAFTLLVSRKLTELFDDPQAQQLFPNPKDMLTEFANLIMYGLSTHQ